MSDQEQKEEVVSIGAALARPLTEREIDVVAGGDPSALTYPPHAPTMPDPHDN